MADVIELDWAKRERERERERLRSRRRHPTQAVTVDMRRFSRKVLAAEGYANPPVEGVERPRTRGDCVHGPRPCPFVACKYHLYLDVNEEIGSITFNFPDLEPDEIPHSCALDVADEGGVTLEDVGGAMNVTREAVRLIQNKGLRVVATDEKLTQWGDGRRRLPVFDEPGGPRRQHQERALLQAAKELEPEEATEPEPALECMEDLEGARIAHTVYAAYLRDSARRGLEKATWSHKDSP